VVNSHNLSQLQSVVACCGNYSSDFSGSEPYTDVPQNSLTHMGRGIIVYGSSLRSQILRLIEVVHH